MIIEKLLKENMGFIPDEIALHEIIKEDRLYPVLVRCNNGRFVSPAQDVLTFTKIIMNSKETYIRDISLMSRGYNFKKY